MGPEEGVRPQLQRYAIGCDGGRGRPVVTRRRNSRLERPGPLLPAGDPRAGQRREARRAPLFRSDHERRLGVGAAHVDQRHADDAQEGAGPAAALLRDGRVHREHDDSVTDDNDEEEED